MNEYVACDVRKDDYGALAKSSQKRKQKKKY